MKKSNIRNETNKITRVASKKKLNGIIKKQEELRSENFEFKSKEFKHAPINPKHNN